MRLAGDIQDVEGVPQNWQLMILSGLFGNAGPTPIFTSSSASVLVGCAEGASSAASARGQGGLAEANPTSPHSSGCHDALSDQAMPSIKSCDGSRSAQSAVTAECTTTARL